MSTTTREPMTTKFQQAWEIATVRAARSARAVEHAKAILIGGALATILIVIGAVLMGPTQIVNSFLQLRFFLAGLFICVGVKLFGSALGRTTHLGRLMDDAIFESSLDAAARDQAHAPAENAGVGQESDSESSAREDVRWLGDILGRTIDAEEFSVSGEPKSNVLSLLLHLKREISRMIRNTATAEVIARFARGERDALSKKLYTPEGLAFFEMISSRYLDEWSYRQVIDAFIAGFERSTSKASADELQSYLSRPAGLIYLMLVHASGRFNKIRAARTMEEKAGH
jgi:hypothetical protein